MKTILILGASSDIAMAIAEVYAKAGNDLILAVRNKDSISDFAGHLQVKYENHNTVLELDILNTSIHRQVYSEMPVQPDGVISAIGYLGSQAEAQQNDVESQRIINTNFNALTVFLEIVAADFVARKTGFVVAISSVAGERGRQSNYFYGAAKAGLTAYLSGLRQRLSSHGIPVLTVKPGFVKTKMTADMALPPVITSTPEKVARMVFRAQQRGKSTIFIGRIWGLIMAIIRNIPEFIFKKLSL
jgi:decaprenylphospho-beta-D-erythro-pentofuranosid-2-ulose 2-reductase